MQAENCNPNSLVISSTLIVRTLGRKLRVLCVGIILIKQSLELQA